MLLRRWWPRRRRTGAASLCVKRRASPLGRRLQLEGVDPVVAKARNDFEIN